MSTRYNHQIKPVLFVVTSHGVKGDTGIPTGFWLSEVTHPLVKFDAAGIKVEFASIQGGQPPVDGFDLNDPINVHYWENPDFSSAIKSTQRIEDVDPSRYAAVFFVGGHGTMWDFANSRAIARVTRQIYEQGGIVSAVCHGLAALVNVTLSDGSYLVASKRLASFTNNEEEEVQATKIVPFMLATALSAHGARHVSAPNWNSNVVIDGRLVTGQNPASAGGVGEAVIALLSAPNTAKSAISFDDVRSVSPTLAKYTTEAIVGKLWNRPGLSARERSIITVSCLITRNQTIGMLHYVNKALDSGVTPSEISEIITHVAFYAGWPNAFQAIAVVKDVFAQRGVSIDQLPSVTPELLPIETVVPDEAVRVAFVAQNFLPVVPALVEFTDEVLYHEIWLRPGLAPRDRNLVTISALVAGGHTTFLPFYLNRALIMGITKEQVSELLTQLAFYSGWPTVLPAVFTVKEVFDSRAL